MNQNNDNKKYLPSSQNANDNKSGDQRYKAKITEEQQQRSDAEREFKKKYDKKTTKEKPGTKKEDIEEPISGEEEIGSHKKSKGRKKFLSFLKDLKRRSAWKKIVFNLRNLFRTKAAVEEEIHKNPKLSKLKSAFGFTSKAEEKILKMRIAYLLQELRQLDRRHQTLNAVMREITIVKQLIALTTSYLKPEVVQDRVAAKEMLTSQVAQTHSTTVDKQQHNIEQAKNTTIEFNKQVEARSSNAIQPVVNPNQLFAYMMQQRPQPIPIEAAVSFGVVGLLISVVQTQAVQAAKFINARVQQTLMAGLKSSVRPVDFNLGADSSKLLQNTKNIDNAHTFYMYGRTNIYALTSEFTFNTKIPETNSIDVRIEPLLNSQTVNIK